MTTTEKYIIKALSNIFRWEEKEIDLVKIANPNTWTATYKDQKVTFESTFGNVLQNIRQEGE